MSKVYPRIRRTAEDGGLVLREGLHLCFFLRRSHGEVAPAVMNALQVYMHTVGSEKLAWYAAPSGELQPLDPRGWEHVHDRVLGRPEANACTLQMEEFPEQVSGFRFEYIGRRLDEPGAARWPGLVSGVSFWLPTEYLEERGPAHVKELAVALARALPLSSGYASLAFNHLGLLGCTGVVRELCFQYPGLDVHNLSSTVLAVGERVRGPYWLNFYGHPLLGQLGGIESLRARLPFPEVGFQQFDGDKAWVALGEWPIAGDEGEEAMKPYRALTQVLEPHLYEEVIRWRSFSAQELRRWQRRFLE